MQTRSARGQRRRRARLAVLLLTPFLLSAPGCASLTGLVTGAFTGCIDAPAQVYRHHRKEMDRHPDYWVYNILLFFPLGLGVGPLAGFAKGVGIDIQWLLNQLDYGEAFGTYRDASVWRPYTIHW